MGGKLTDLTGQLTDVAENGGQLPAIGSRIPHGESPAGATVSEKAKSVKDSVVDRAKDLTGGGGRPGSGDAKVTNIWSSTTGPVSSRRPGTSGELKAAVCGSTSRTSSAM
ncbi:MULTISPECIES: hypothetical protein [unclassified Streptomyces]|uniref:hypothetical protein n=1 Tax=unclassified Streptomyces TaxID=2593676 RepID=UPI003862D869